MTQYQASMVSVRGISLIEEFPETPQDLSQDRIQILDGTQKIRSVICKRDGMTIGREQNNDIFIDSPKVSRQHARVEFNGVNYVIIDLDSTNGTILGSTKLLPGVPEVWAPEKVVRIGDAFLRLELVQGYLRQSGNISGGPKPQHMLIRHGAVTLYRKSRNLL
jgi:pSer/pThr/pTyr-binding forkhead associated (FHA) protein